MSGVEKKAGADCESAPAFLMIIFCICGVSNRVLDRRGTCPPLRDPQQQL